MGQAQLIKSGTLTVMPLTVTGTATSASPLGSVPAGTTQIPLSTTPSPKPSNVMAKGSKRLNSTGSMQALSGVGATDDVTTGDFLYFKTDTAVQLELTMQDFAAGGVGSTVSVIYVAAELEIEFPSQGYLTGLRAQGAASIEYIVSGPA